jgi:hypothetical protein
MAAPSHGEKTGAAVHLPWVGGFGRWKARQEVMCSFYRRHKGGNTGRPGGLHRGMVEVLCRTHAHAIEGQGWSANGGSGRHQRGADAMLHTLSLSLVWEGEVARCHAGAAMQRWRACQVVPYRWLCGMRES